MDSSIANSCEISDRLRIASHGIRLPSDDKYVIPSIMFSMALEHHVSIISLIRDGYVGSAASLVRCLFEAYVKGIWFHECAQERDFIAFKKDKFDHRFGQLVSDIEAVRGKGISKPKENYWKALNSLTHTGAFQVNRRFDGQAIAAKYTDEFSIDTLNFANNYALLCCLELARMSSDHELFECVISVANDLGFVRNSL